MKRNVKWIIAAILVLAVIALLVLPVGKPFTLPFTAEEVSSVTLWSFWGYKETTEVEEISAIVEEMNGTRLCGEFDFENYEMREGDYGCVFSFCLKDGRTYEYTAIPKPGLTTIFQDADGAYYKAKNVPMQRLYNDLEQELQPGNPF